MVYRDVKSKETKQMDEGASLDIPPGWEEENQLEPRYTWQVHWSDTTCVQSVQNVPAASCVPSEFSSYVFIFMETFVYLCRHKLLNNFHFPIRKIQIRNDFCHTGAADQRWLGGPWQQCLLWREG